MFLLCNLRQECLKTSLRRLNALNTHQLLKKEATFELELRVVLEL